MKFFYDYNQLSFIVLTDLPSPDTVREPYLKTGGVTLVERPGTALVILPCKHDDSVVTGKVCEWFQGLHKLLNMPQPDLSFVKNEKKAIIGVASVYASVADRRRIEHFILMPFRMPLNFPYIKRFHLKGLPTASAGKFSDDDAWVRLIVRNDALIFALMVNHEGHDYTLTHPRHLVWARQLCAELGIEIMDIEYDADMFLSSAEEFERLYDFITVHAVSSGYH